jgi:hypothetical protein
MSEERPPWFKHWKGMYLFVLGVLVLQIVIYYLITKAY